YTIHSKNIQHRNAEIGFSPQLHEYRFETLWMALNQENHRTYQGLADEGTKKAMLNSVLVGHVLSVFSNLNIKLQTHERLMANVSVKEKSANFKDNKMVAFEGGFVLNAILPDGIGLGKAVS